MNNNHTANCLFNISDFEQVKEKVLNWLQQFDTFCFLDNHQYQLEPHSLECLAGVQAGGRPGGDHQNGFRFGHISYDYKNVLEDISSSHPDHIHFPDQFFFTPSIVIRFTETQMMIEAANAEGVFHEIMDTGIPTAPPIHPVKNIRSRFSKEQYIATIQRLKEHILRGDCYEINFCQEFYATETMIDPVQVYKKLSAISPNPFSALYRLKDKWLLCASPERFLKKTGSKLLSQPIKGTAKRELHDETKDSAIRMALQQSAKDRSENVMVVDLVRNDLAKVCQEGSVKVEELYGVYSFPQVHQMISTISGILRQDVSFDEIIKATFPMGSMTGAPKKRVMELIEQYEQSRRGIFSGAVGYIDPTGDFDFNVVIRSIMYNASSRYLSYQVGSGITFYSDPVLEWEECLLKAAAIKKVLGEDSSAN